MNRRDVLRLAAGAAAATTLPSSSEGAEKRLEVYLSSLSEANLESQKEAAVRSLEKSLPDIDALDYLRAYLPHMRQESQMYLPQSEEVREVISKSGRELTELASHVQKGSNGLFVFADVGENGGPWQRLYVLKRERDGVRFEKAYPVSTAMRGFGNEADSLKTPLGLHQIRDGERGMFGEVVSARNEHGMDFNLIRFQGKEHWFVKAFGGEDRREVPGIVTDQYLLVGPQTSASRGIRLHGTNRSGKILSNGSWKTLLGGRQRSAGCIRMSNTDIRDLSLSGYVWTPQDKRMDSRTGGTYIMVHATKTAMESAGELTEYERKTWGPPRRQPGVTEIPAPEQKYVPHKYIPPKQGE